MEKKEWDAIQDDILTVQNMAASASYLPIAIALALIDKGTIDVGRLRDIIASLRAIQAADFELRLGSLEDAEIGLNQFEQYLTGWDWKPGHVVEQLRLYEASESARVMLRQATKRPDID